MEDIKRNCMTHVQSHKLMTFLEALAEDGYINMTAVKIGEASEQTVGMVPAKQSVQKSCRDLGIKYDKETRATTGKVQHRIDVLLEAVVALEVRVVALENPWKDAPPMPPPIPKIGGGSI